MISRLRNLFVIKEFTGRHMLGVLFLFFGTIITVNMILTWFALSSWSGLVAKNGYVASIDFETKRKDVERQNRLGWKSRLRLNGNHVIFSIKDSAGKPITGLSLTGTIGRPTTEIEDKTIAFHEGNSGEYLGPVDIKSGQWDVTILAVNSKKDQYRKIYRFVKEPRK